MKLLLLLFIMLTYFDEAFIVSEDALGLLVEQDFSTDRLFDFAVASCEVEESNSSFNDEDGLYNESVSYVP
jgi:hypothetical protein